MLAAASYFTPVLSCVFVTFWIDEKLDSGFWSGVAQVVAGALLCRDATGRGMRALTSHPKWDALSFLVHVALLLPQGKSMIATEL